jgi:exodeoxyribonuclease VII small subunit
MSKKNMAYDLTADNLSLEEAFEKLDTLIEELEKPENSLEASFRAFEQGMQLVKYCNDAIDKVEKKVLVLGQDGELDEF